MVPGRFYATGITVPTDAQALCLGYDYTNRGGTQTSPWERMLIIFRRDDLMHRNAEASGGDSATQQIGTEWFSRARFGGSAVLGHTSADELLVGTSQNAFSNGRVRQVTLYRVRWGRDY